MMKKLMIISYHAQFGYHTDLYNYVLNLKDKYKIIFISRDLEEKKVHLDEVEVIYFTQVENGLKMINKLKAQNFIKDIIKSYSPDYVFFHYYTLCSMLKSIKGPKYIIDYRTLDISTNKIKSKIRNVMMSIEGRYFKNRCVITEDIGKKLRFNKFKVVPLGGKSFNEVEMSQKLNFEVLRFVYVGTFSNRGIDNIIRAFNRLSEKYDGKNMELILIGDSPNYKEQNIIQSEIEKNKYNNIIYLGKVNNEKLGEYFKYSNVGISYIPITKEYNLQPPTKTYEYLFNGLYTIGTKTIENCKIINKVNGILINDNEESLFCSMNHIYNERFKFEIFRFQLKETVIKNEWSLISNNLYEYLEELIQ